MRNSYRIAACLLAVAGWLVFAQQRTVGQWASLPEISSTAYRSWHQMATMDGKLYVFGGLEVQIGQSSGSFVSSSIMLDMTGGATKWVRVANLPEARAGGYAAAINGKIYIAGGYYSSGSTRVMAASVLEYDPATDQFTKKADIPTPVYQVAGAVVGGKIYILNGYNSAGTVTSGTQVYDPATDTWAAQSAPPAASAYSAAAAVDNTIYLIGGTNSSAYNNFVYKGVVAEDGSITWSSAASYPTPLTRLAAGSLNGKVYATAGAYNGTALDATYSYDPATNKWGATYALPAGTYNVASMPSDGTGLYMVSGYQTPKVYKYTEGEPTAIGQISPASRSEIMKPDTTRNFTVVVRNTGIVPLSATITIPNDASWLTATPPEAVDVPAGGSKNVTFTIDTKGLAEQNYEANVEFATNAKGQEKLSLMVNLTVTTKIEKRRSLQEVFTSSTCPPCKPGNDNLHTILKLYPVDDYTVVKYQQDFPGTGDPYATDETVNRRGYYGINSIPRMEVDGGWDGNANSYTPQLYAAFTSVPTFHKINSSIKVEGTTVTVTTEIVPGIDINSNNLRLHTLIIENRTEKNVKSNGEQEFFQVVKKMLPDDKGRAIEPLKAGVPVTFTETFTFQGSYRLSLDGKSANRINHATENSVENFKNLNAVVFLQDNATREVFQSAWPEPVEGAISSVAVEPNNDANGLAVLANRDNSIVTLNYATQAPNATVAIAIYDLLGNRVYAAERNVAEKGDQVEMIANGRLKTGVYLAEVTTPAGVKRAKFVLSR